MNLQRTDTGRKVDDARYLSGGECIPQGLRTQAKREIKIHIAKFYEDILITRAANDHIPLPGDDCRAFILADEPHFISRPQLTQFPEIGFSNDRRANKSAAP